jgi:putative transcriptional regulator
MKYKSEIYEVVHQDATAMFEIGAISETEMRKFDEMCFAQDPEKENALEKTTALEHTLS